MKYISTRNNKKEFDFKAVFIKGLADDGGLFIPKSLKKYSNEDLQELKKLNYNQLSIEIINQFSSDFITKVIIAISNKGTGTPPTCKAKTSLGIGQSTGVDALPFI